MCCLDAKPLQKSISIYIYMRMQIQLLYIRMRLHKAPQVAQSSSSCCNGPPHPQVGRRQGWRACWSFCVSVPFCIPMLIVFCCHTTVIPFVIPLSYPGRRFGVWVGFANSVWLSWAQICHGECAKKICPMLSYPLSYPCCHTSLSYPLLTVVVMPQFYVLRRPSQIGTRPYYIKRCICIYWERDKEKYRYTEIHKAI